MSQADSALVVWIFGGQSTVLPFRSSLVHKVEGELEMVDIKHTIDQSRQSCKEKKKKEKASSASTGDFLLSHPICHHSS